MASILDIASRSSAKVSVTRSLFDKTAVLYTLVVRLWVVKQSETAWADERVSGKRQRLPDPGTFLQLFKGSKHGAVALFRSGVRVKLRRKAKAWPSTAS
jgi:hypothetical protein